jgi:hypothetical protein
MLFKKILLQLAFPDLSAAAVVNVQLTRCSSLLPDRAGRADTTAPVQIKMEEIIEPSMLTMNWYKQYLSLY